MKKNNFLIIIILGLLISNFVLAIPQNINVQGRLTNSSNNTLTGIYNMTFKIYDASTGGTALWNLINQSVTTDFNGVYNIILSDINLSFEEQYYLGIQVESDSEMIPRINLTSSPYAFRAQNITLSGIKVDSDLNLGGYNLTVGGGWLAGGMSILGSDIFARALYVYNITSLNVNNLFMNGSIFPSFDDTFDLGNSSLRWQDLFLSGQVYSNGTGNNWFLGNLGIGTASPGAKLDVNGTIRATSINAPPSGVGTEVYYNPIVVSGGIQVYNRGTGAWGTTVIDGNPIILNHYSHGYVGIGLSGPNRPLQVRGLSTADKWGNTILAEDNRTQAVGTGGGITFGGKYTDAGAYTIGGYVRLEKQTAITGEYGFDLLLGARTDLALPVEVMRLHNGNVGIGTASPSQTLDVRGQGNFSGTIYINNITDISTFGAGYWNLSGINLYPNRLDYNVGIGTANPTQALDIHGNINLSGDLTLGTNNKISFNMDDSASANGISINYINDVIKNVYSPIHIEVSGNGPVQGIEIINEVSSPGGVGLFVNTSSIGQGIRIDSSSSTGEGMYINNLGAKGLYIANSYNQGYGAYLTGDGSLALLYLQANNPTETAIQVATGKSTFAGSVGIGTANPTHTLNVVGNANITGDLWLRGVNFTGGGTPAGAIMAFNSVSCPTGWIIADGSSGTPDLRGIFVRGAGTSGVLNMSNGTRFSAIYGAYYNDSFQGHRHSFFPEAVSLPFEGDELGGAGAQFSLSNFYVGNPVTDTTNGVPRTGAETTPAYYALTYCMKTTEDSVTSNTIWGESGNNIFVQNISKNVGIGTTSPNYLLEVRGKTYLWGVQGNDFVLDVDATSVNDGYGVRFAFPANDMEFEADELNAAININTAMGYIRFYGGTSIGTGAVNLQEAEAALKVRGGLYVGNSDSGSVPDGIIHIDKQIEMKNNVSAVSVEGPGVGAIYISKGALYYMGSSGTITKIANA